MDAVAELITKSSDGLVLWLTGAGISAESGVPTFRGEEGYWRVGSRNYQPQQMATRAMFGELPAEVWAWYLYRRGVCRLAEPNVAHRALAALEERMAERFLLVTQNVDGLHLRAGNSPARTFQIHGNIDFMRCARECLVAPVPIPDTIDLFWERGRPLNEAELDALRCAACGSPTRPHVLWFDEYYDEQNFRFESSMRAAEAATLIIVVGTTGATNLPLRMGQLAAVRGIPLLVINSEPNPFSDLVQESERGAFLEGTTGRWVPYVADLLSPG